MVERTLARLRRFRRRTLRYEHRPTSTKPAFTLGGARIRCNHLQRFCWAL